MIKTFADRDTEQFWRTGKSQGMPANLRKAAKRKLAMIDSAARVEDLRIPPGNRLEHLHGSREGQYSIRINDQYRVCFTWREGDAHDVEVVDYHD